MRTRPFLYLSVRNDRKNKLQSFGGRGARCRQIKMFSIILQPPEGVIDSTVYHQLRGPFLNLFWCDLIEKGKRVTVHVTPEIWVQVTEKADDLWVPRPPEVLSQGIESSVKMAIWACHYNPPYLDRVMELDKTVRKGC